MSRKKFTIDNIVFIRLKSLIEYLGISQAQFANNIGITQGYLSMILKGKRGASAELLAGLYNYYSEYFHWVLTGEGEITQKETNDAYIYKVGAPFDDDPIVADLLASARKVLKSGNPVAFDALERNIHHFAHAIEMEKRMATIESELTVIKQKQERLEKVDKKIREVEMEKESEIDNDLPLVKKVAG